ncbi:hypothetical protein F5890DRAFT_849192 [Lentinula detonsa]|uniref:Uncharacterized protein n=1 Tax=Lentinula detonsa TaxID=2804962 RepID=A0AA38PR28_9AGAR|nr:hypothetical protein F5890DRAFT_849192 [Lentinula detonsa]
MSSHSGAESTTTSVMTAAEFESWTLTPTLIPSDDHTNSTSTRPPSFYDKHIPKALQPKIIYLGKPHYQPDSSDISDPGFAIDHYYSQLCKRPDVLKLLTGTVRDDLRSRWKVSLQFIRQLDIQNEDGVVDAEKQVASIVYNLTSLLLFDLSKDQLENFGNWKALATHSSTETEAKADILLGLHKKAAILQSDSQNSSQSRCEAIWPLLQHLDLDFMRHLTSMECKNLKLGDPMGYLALLLLSCLTQQVQLDLWPKAHCHDCGKFRKSHEVQFGRATVQLPLDSPEKYGLTTLPLSSDAADVNAEIGRVLDLVLADRHPDGLDPDATKKRRNPTNTGEFYDRVRQPMLNLLRSLESQPTMEVLDQFDDKSELLNDIMRWVNTVRDIFIQACAQLIRHNLTFCTVTSYNNSYLFHRNRKTGDITMSPLQSSSKAGHIIQRAVWLSESFHDSKDRSEIDDQWDDPYRGVKSNLLPDPAVSSSQEGDDPELDPEYQPNESDLNDDDHEAIKDEVNAHGQKALGEQRACMLFNERV